MYFSYRGQEKDTLAELRYSKFIQLLTTSTVVDPSELPPTERAAHFHSLRVHLQVCQWVTLDLECLNPAEWGWKFENEKLVPIKTDLDPAPQFLLNVIRCNCQITTRNPCGGLNCSCRKHGIECVAACGNCRGEFCTNMVVVENIAGDDHEDLDRNVFDLFV